MVTFIEDGEIIRAQKNGENIGTIVKVGSQFNAKGSWFNVTLSSLEGCKECFQTPEKRNKVSYFNNQIKIAL